MDFFRINDTKKVGDKMYIYKNENTIRFRDGLTVMITHRQILYHEVEIPTTKKEFDVLRYFAGQPGRVFTKAQILQTAGSEDPQDEDNAVRCLIAGIRKKLRKYTDKEYIQTVRGVGYRFVIPEE